MKQKVNTFTKNFGIFLVLILSFWAVKPLFEPGFFPMHDDTQVARVFEMGKALKDGMFPVRWVSDLGYGYGYPIFNFYAPLAYYIGGFFNLIGFDPLTATKIMMVLGILLSAVFMYLLAREFWGTLGGIVSGLFYVYALYHALDIYVRGDVAEFWAYALIPLMSWGFYKVFTVSLSIVRHSCKSKTHPESPAEMIDSGKVGMTIDIWKWIIVGSVGYAGVVLSHNLTAMMVTPFLIIVSLFYCFIAYKNKHILTTYYLLLTTILGLMLSAFYWVPALLEMKYTNVLSQIGGGADFRDHFVCLSQLWNSPWGFGGSISGCIDGLSFKIGKLHMFLAGAAICLSVMLSLTSYRLVPVLVQHLVPKEPRFRFRQLTDGMTIKQVWNGTRRDSNIITVVWLSFLGFIISVFLMLEISKPIWESIPFMAFFQYPWRFLLLALFFSSFLAGFIVWFLSPSTSTSKESFGHLRGATNSFSVFTKLKYFNTVPYLSGMILIFLLVSFNSKLFQPQTILPKTSLDYTNEVALKWTASKISDEYMPKDFYKPESEEGIVRERFIIDKNLVTVERLTDKTNIISARLAVFKETKVHINLAHFPAWEFFVNGNKTVYDKAHNGYQVFLPLGEHTLDIRFKQTLIEKIANTVTLAGIVIVAIGIIIGRRKRLSV